MPTPRIGPRWVLPTAGFLIAFFALLPDGPRGHAPGSLVQGLAEVAAAVSCLLTARHVRGRARTVWALFAAGLSCWALTDLTAAALLARGTELPVLGPLDIGWIAFYPLVLTGVVLLYERLRPERGWQGLMDAHALVIGVACLAWVTTLRPAVSDRDTLEVTVSALYPALDLLSCVGLGWVLIRHGRNTPDWMRWIVAAVGCQAVAGLAALEGSAIGISSVEAPVTSAAYVMASLMWVSAGRRRRASHERSWRPGVHSAPPAWSRALPFLGAGAVQFAAFLSGNRILGLVAGAVWCLAGLRIVETMRINQRLIEERDRLLVTDPLTGVNNRRYFEAELTRAAARTMRSGEPLALISFDLDRFKAVNDTFGHGAGDDLLSAVSAAATGVIRAGDVLCRLGGDEFVVIAPNADGDGGAQIAERIRVAVHEAAEAVIPGGGVTSSLGVASIPQHGLHPTDVLLHADEALYTAKSAGRNCVRVYDPAENPLLVAD
ncbi:MAG: GGDEF domain-containing protein [Thermoleophilia bacterium]